MEKERAVVRPSKDDARPINPEETLYVLLSSPGILEALLPLCVQVRSMGRSTRTDEDRSEARKTLERIWHDAYLNLVGGLGGDFDPAPFRALAEEGVMAPSRVANRVIDRLVEALPDSLTMLDEQIEHARAILHKVLVDLIRRLAQSELL